LYYTESERGEEAVFFGKDAVVYVVTY